jgi:hypothetical protein
MWFTSSPLRTGNRICKQLVVLLDGLGRMETWLRHRGRADLRGCDRSILAGSFERLGRDAASVAELAEDLASDLETA